MRKIILFSTLFFLVGCSKSTIVLLDNGKVQNAVIVQTNKGKSQLNEVGSFVNLKDKESLPSEVKKMSKEEIKSRFAKALSASPLKPLKYVLYFTNATELTEESRKNLEQVFVSIKERSPCIVDVIGHTDTVGSSALNLKVSLKRAKYVESLLKQKNIKVVSLVAKGYGEEDLLVPTKDNQAEAKNRNVEIFIK